MEVLQRSGEKGGTAETGRKTECRGSHTPRRRVFLWRLGSGQSLYFSDWLRFCVGGVKISEGGGGVVGWDSQSACIKPHSSPQFAASWASPNLQRSRLRQRERSEQNQPWAAQHTRPPPTGVPLEAHISSPCPLTPLCPPACLLPEGATCVRHHLW